MLNTSLLFTCYVEKGSSLLPGLLSPREAYEALVHVGQHSNDLGDNARSAGLADGSEVPCNQLETIGGQIMGDSGDTPKSSYAPKWPHSFQLSAICRALVKR